jgi:hypothetical protein
VDRAVFWATLPKIERKFIQIHQLSDSDAKLKFRFHSANDLNLLFIGLHFPQKFTAPRVGRKFSGEEVFLSGIYLAFPNRFDDDGWKIRFGFDHQTASQAVSLFYRFMVRNWAYLLFDNLEFWLPFIPRFNQAIRLKCSELGCQYDDLKIFGFIDNTLNSTCRPGGGPACDGENAPRNDPDIQRAYYTGWKKMHG